MVQYKQTTIRYSKNVGRIPRNPLHFLHFLH